MATRRPWHALPDPALVNIFRRSTIKDRARSFPFVCQSWAHAFRHPSCWSSMVADAPYSSPDDSFVKLAYPYGDTFPDFLDGQRSSNSHGRGLTRFRSFIQSSVGGGANITSLYFFPFLTANSDSDSNDDALLCLIAQSCSNLKHLSFHGSYRASFEAVSAMIQCCNKLELVDFSDTPYFESSVLQILSSSCPNLRGIRRNGYVKPSFASVFSKEFSSLRLLNLSDTPLLDTDLLTIVTRCQGLMYLDIRRCQQLLRYMYLVKGASARIVQILFD